MAKQRCAVGAAEIDVFAAVEVPQMAAGAAVEVERMAKSLIDAGGGGDAGGQRFFCQLELLFNTVHKPTACMYSRLKARSRNQAVPNRARRIEMPIATLGPCFQ